MLAVLFVFYLCYFVINILVTDYCVLILWFPTNPAVTNLFRSGSVCWLLSGCGCFLNPSAICANVNTANHTTNSKSHNGSCHVNYVKPHVTQLLQNTAGFDRSIGLAWMQPNPGLKTETAFYKVSDSGGLTHQTHQRASTDAKPMALKMKTRRQK